MYSILTALGYNWLQTLNFVHAGRSSQKKNLRTFAGATSVERRGIYRVRYQIVESFKQQDCMLLRLLIYGSHHAFRDSCLYIDAQKLIDKLLLKGCPNSDDEIGGVAIAWQRCLLRGRRRRYVERIGWSWWWKSLSLSKLQSFVSHVVQQHKQVQKFLCTTYAIHHHHWLYALLNYLGRPYLCGIWFPSVFHPSFLQSLPKLIVPKYVTTSGDQHFHEF